MKELAYCGFGFWLPLVFVNNDNQSKRIANQGLWVLIMAIVSCNTIRALGSLNLLLKYTFFFMISNAIYSFTYIIFLGFMFYLSYKCIVNVKAIHEDRDVEEILFFDEIRIIK